MTVLFKCIDCGSKIYLDELLFTGHESKKNKDELDSVCLSCKRKYFIKKIKYILPEPIWEITEEIETSKDKYPLKRQDLLLLISAGVEKYDCSKVAIANLSRNWIYVFDESQINEIVVFKKAIVKDLVRLILPALIVPILLAGLNTSSTGKKINLKAPVVTIAIAGMLGAYRFYQSDLQKDRSFPGINSLKIQQNISKEIYELEEKIQDLTKEIKQANSFQSCLKEAIGEMKRVGRKIYRDRIIEFQDNITKISELKQQNKHLIKEYKKLIEMIKIQVKLDRATLDSSREYLLFIDRKEELLALEQRKEELSLLANPDKLLL